MNTIARPDDEARAEKLNGHGVIALAVDGDPFTEDAAPEANPYNTPELQERRRLRREAEEVAEAAASVEVVSGPYASDVSTGLSAAAKKSLARLSSVAVIVDTARAENTYAALLGEKKLRPVSLSG